MRKVSVIIANINPEAWKMPDLSVGRAKGRVYAVASTNEVVRRYQEAITEALEEALPEGYLPFPRTENIRLRIVIMRTIEQYVTDKGRTMTRNRQDATNIQKATEDALQKILFENDIQCTFVSTEIIAQEKGVEPGIYIELSPHKVPGGWEHVFMRLRSMIDPGKNAHIFIGKELTD